MRGFFLLIVAVAVSMAVIPVAMWLAPRLGMVDQPDPRKVHRQPVPRVGGWGIVAGCLLPLLLLDAGDPVLASFIAGSLVLFLFGAWDDARQTGHWIKFAGQGLAVAIVVYGGDLYVTRLPFLETWALDPALGRLFTVFAMVGCINAINHSDGLDGLAGGETLLSFVAIAFLGFLIGSTLVTDLALAVIGGTVGFLRFNTHPARVFMGDSGSQFLGFTVAFLVIYLVQVANPAASAALPLLLIGLPIADILVVLYKRASGGMNWFKATRNHVHHRLLDLGFSHHHSVVAIYTLQALLVVLAVLLRYADDGLVIGIYLAAIIALFASLSMAERSGWRLEEASARGWIKTLAKSRRMDSRHSQLALLWLIATTLAGLFLFVAFWVREIPRDIAAAAGGVAVVLALVSLGMQRARSTAMRMGVYVAVAFATWLFIQYPRGVEPPTGLATVVIAGLALAVAFFVRFLSDGRFGTTPTDYLIVFALLALTVFGHFAGGSPLVDGMLQFLTYAIVLFYGCEILISHLARWQPVLGGAAVAMLLIVAVRGLTTTI